ncbi:rhomboid family intramembrane serine protease [Roseinatronobacter alkalisoli]|uniref:Rhomboid family intramembrane serine protease n=1 Tax=Roseinatronobacter alkalisoli TaxID=3028235 RepID=A0ABT5T697_9RHOB|nr:rhomboid family intramembrane serine protease [Roseinatronobacter sp. HJB301]MDD7970569.1 rhomboid family intramembrane serine protease [Roseinatronobacter sp. HJB301]
MNTPPAPILSPLPWGVWLLALTIGAVELVLWAGAHGLVNAVGAAGWRAQAMAWAGVNPALQGWMLDTGQTPLRHLSRYVAFGFVHMGPVQALLVVVIIAALGKYCAERLGSARVLLILALAQAAGGAAFGMVGDAGAWLVGGYPLIFALAGIYAALARDMAPDRRALLLALALPLVLLIARLTLAAIMGGMDWVADVVACATAFALAIALRPGLLVRLRRR